MRFGSSACLIRACRPRNSGDAACGHHGSFARPIPCSPVMAPPHAMIWRKSSSSALIGPLLHAALGHVGHDVHVNVTIAGVAEGGDLDPVLLLQARGEGKQVDQPAARDANVFVELGQPRRLERGGELAAQFPEALAIGLGRRGGDVERAVRPGAGRPASGLPSEPTSGWPSISIRRCASPRGRCVGAEMPTRGFEGKTIRQFERRGKEAFAKQMLHAGGGDGGIGERRGERSSGRAARE